MNRLKTLRVRFALWTAGLLLAALTLFGLFVYANMSRNLAAAVDEALRLIVIQLSAEIEMIDGELVVEESVEDMQLNLLDEQGFSMRVLNLAGQTVEAYGPYADLLQPQAGPFGGLRAGSERSRRVELIDPEQPGEYTTMIDPASRDAVRVYTTPIIEGNQVIGIVRVAQNLKDVRRTLNLLLGSLLIGGPLMVILAGSGGYFLAARALSPIDKVTLTARRTSAKDLSARLDLPETDDEVGRLVTTFDSMLARLDDAFRRERQFTADASHELRTPLSAMQTIISSTLARRRAPADYEQALIDLSQEAEQMRTLTEGLLDLARHDATRPPARFERVNLSNLLKDVVASLQPLAEEKGLLLVDKVPAEDLTLMGDSDGLIRLFVNVLANAVKYTEQGFITVSATAKDGELLAVTITDTGVGITAEHLPYIFDRFYRVDESRSEDGSGLGLAIALNVAQAHGGKIDVESKAGKGTTITVQLSTG